MSESEQQELSLETLQVGLFNVTHSLHELEGNQLDFQNKTAEALQRLSSTMTELIDKLNLKDVKEEVKTHEATPSASPSQHPNHDVAELLCEGLKYILIHAAYVSIGSVKKFPTIATPFRKGNVGSPHDLSPHAFC